MACSGHIIKLCGAVAVSFCSTLFAAGYTYTHIHNLKNHLNGKQTAFELPLPTLIFYNLSVPAISVPILLSIILIWLLRADKMNDFSVTLFVHSAWVFSFFWD